MVVDVPPSEAIRKIGGNLGWVRYQVIADSQHNTYVWEHFYILTIGYNSVSIFILYSSIISSKTGVGILSVDSDLTSSVSIASRP